ncbi:MAG: hypothetical protein KFW21_00265 [Spirochaetota bacterium]|nr:hypothetical protein [Spirochaetota bacterium]
MKKYLLFVIILISNVTYTRVNNIVEMMSPTDRYNLFLSTKEVADAYKNQGRIQKADSFYRLAVDIYPIGDETHQLANELNISLNDEQTYTNFIELGDKNLQNKQYRKAQINYFMANKLSSSSELYVKIANTYEGLGNTTEAIYYQGLSENQFFSETANMKLEQTEAEQDAEVASILLEEYLLEEHELSDEDEMLFEKSPSNEKNMVNTSDLNAIIEIDYEEQLN